MSAPTPEQTFRVYDCQCGTTVNTMMSKCPKCGLALDPNQAAAAADHTAFISRAVSDARFLKTMGPLCFIALLVVRLFMGQVLGSNRGGDPRAAGALYIFGMGAVVIVSLSIPGGALRWFSRYGKIATADPDYGKAKRAVWVSLGWFGATVGVAGLLSLLVLKPIS
jgi:hypothetical protein